MKKTDRGLSLSATDLSSFFECAHKTTLALGVEAGTLTRPGQSDIERKMLEKRGLEHESRVLEYYRTQGLTPFDIGAQPLTDATTPTLAKATLEAMKRGEPVIYRGVLVGGDWVGRPDFLVRVDTPSRLGGHSYEPLDAKLARSEKARAVLQLCVYADLLGRVQVQVPDNLWLALGATEVQPSRLRTADYFAYYRQAKQLLGDFVGDEDREEPYPEPCEHCDVCEWWRHCDKRRRADDHLSLVAGITRRQRNRLEAQGVDQLIQLAKLPREQAVEGIEEAPLNKIREQARLQAEGRRSGNPVYELITDGDPGTGLELLPEPRPGDLFLDLEGDSFFAGGAGLEYLFGLIELGPVGEEVGWGLRKESGPPNYLAFWATTPDGEKRAFEQVIKRIDTGLAEFSDLHVYHFGRRENEALKKLSCKHGVGEDVVDRLLRDDHLVDLHTVVRQGLRASVEAYSLKELEPLHGFKRNVALRDAAKAMQFFGWWLESADPEIPVDDLRATLARYNEDDCLSTWKLRDWLEQQRTELEKVRGRPVPRPILENKTDTKEVNEREKEIEDLTQRLVGELPPPEDTEPDEYKARRLLANLLGWHWRELKSDYWEHHEARQVPPSEWLESRFVLTGLEYQGIINTVKRSEIHQYTFPEQDHAVRTFPQPIVAGDHPKGAKVVRIGPGFVDIMRGKIRRDEHPHALRPGKPLPSQDQARQLINIAHSVAFDGLEDRTRYGAARDLLLRRPPRCGQRPEAALVESGEETLDAVKRLALALDDSVLAVQGPPGSGKSYRGAHAILELVKAGKRVGVTANSHQVIVELLKKVHAIAREAGVSVDIQHMADEERFDEELPFELGKDGVEVAARIASGGLQVVGGTTFAWTTEHFDQVLDVLVVDEAGQMSLANALAVSTAAKSMVLLGDPAQLEQPQKGVHPEGADVSGLEHVLGPDHATMPENLGVFLPETRRLHPDICGFTSEVFYESRLEAHDGLEKQRINGPEPFDGSGLRFVPVAHEGNTNRSDEEVEAIAQIVDQLFAKGTTFTDAAGNERSLLVDHKNKDVLVVAPYNVQVGALKHRLPPERVEVGTVDKFQGKEAPIVIYSMTTSSAEEAPRGLEFLFSLNRLNVATSRAQAMVILVASPELTKAKCRTPRQLRLVNALCSYIQGAQ